MTRPRKPPTQWPHFEYQGIEYKLAHLDGFQAQYVKPAQGDKPAITYKVFVYFGHHCFTEGIKAGDDPQLCYRHAPNGDRRTFDFTRYALSTQLPALVRNLMNVKCFHTGKGNYFTIHLTTHNGQTVDYEVYFKLYRSQEEPRGLRLVVESAYPRDPARLGNRPKLDPVGFGFLLHNTQVGKPIKPTRK